MKNSFISQIIVLFVLCIGELTSVQWNDLRIHFSLDRTNGFFRQGRTSIDAGKNGLECISLDCKNGGSQFVGFRYQDPKDDGVVLIYDVNGIIAGIQSRFPHDLILQPTTEFRYDLVPMFQNVTENGKTYFVVTVYFVDPATICEKGREEKDLEEQGTGTGLWIQNGSTAQDFIKAPLDRTTAINQRWTRNSCFAGMGYHNFYDLENINETNCTQALPIFLLFNAKEELIGFGFQTEGRATSKYFEHPQNIITRAIFGLPIPSCVLARNVITGTTTLHVYFVDKPWEFTCAG